MDDLPGIKTATGPELAASVRTALPHARTFRDILKQQGVSRDVAFVASVISAVELAAKAGIEEEDLIRYVRQMFVICRCVVTKNVEGVIDEIKRVNGTHDVPR